MKLRDVNGGALTASAVSAHYDQLGPGGQLERIARRLVVGAPTALALASSSVLFGISAAAFADEAITVAATSGGWLADSPAGSVTQQGDLVTLEVTMGSVRFAPTVTLPPDAPIQDNPRAALVDPAGGWRYRDVPLPPVDVERLSVPVDFQDPAGAGWAKFVHEKVRVEPALKGAYLLLEYGHPSEDPGRAPRFLIAVWAPRVALGTTPQVLTFFSPPTKPADYAVDTYPFRTAYPYASHIKPPPTPARAAAVHPPYTLLPARYLGVTPRPIIHYHIVYQLLAAGRNPIVIMPIHPSAQWGPLASQRGLCRLVKEVVRFLYARQLVSGRSAPPAQFTLSGGRPSVVPPRNLLTSEAIPQDWALTVAGFSNGIDKVLDLCSQETFDDKSYAPALFDAAPGTLLSSWREIWDIDGVADDGRGAQRHLTTLQTWLQRSRRSVRSYHSDDGGRTQPRDLVSASRLETRPRSPVKGVKVQEGTSADGRATLVHFADAALGDLGIDNAHHTVVAVAFGHAAQFPLP